MWGMARSIINNMVKGVSVGYKEELEINGVGFRSSLKDDILTMNLGFSHSVKIRVPKDIKVNVVKNTNIEVSGIDKQRLGQFLSLVISQRPVEPYKGKGIKIKGQVVIRKEGKKK
jgi:large subunit ribosomal protein L6